MSINLGSVIQSSDLEDGQLINVGDSAYCITVGYLTETYTFIHKETGAPIVTVDRAEIRRIAAMAKEAETWPKRMRG